MMLVYFLVPLFVSLANPVDKCPRGYFRLNSMSRCHVFLNCRDFKKVEVLEVIGHGVVKTVHKAKWMEHTIAVSYLRTEYFEEDFMHGWDMLQYFQGPYVVQLVGFCFESKAIMTEFHPLGHAVGVLKKLSSLGMNIDSPLTRIDLCWNYAKVLERLHDENFVNCDSNSLMKTLSQLLVTADGSLVINDLDSLAEHIDGVTCGSRPLYGNFVAPEQIGYPLPKYGEKIDIWKAADVCNYFFAELANSTAIMYRLLEVHSKCKSVVASDRPSATDLAAAYANIRKIVHEDL